MTPRASPLETGGLLRGQPPWLGKPKVCNWPGLPPTNGKERKVKPGHSPPEVKVIQITDGRRGRA
jgi:hypothetical protein